MEIAMQLQMQPWTITLLQEAKATFDARELPKAKRLGKESPQIYYLIALNQRTTSFLCCMIRWDLMSMPHPNTC
jgi:hypothetical protein